MRTRTIKASVAHGAATDRLMSVDAPRIVAVIVWSPGLRIAMSWAPWPTYPSSDEDHLISSKLGRRS